MEVGVQVNIQTHTGRMTKVWAIAHSSDHKGIFL